MNATNSPQLPPPPIGAMPQPRPLTFREQLAVTGGAAPDLENRPQLPPPSVQAPDVG